MDRQPLGESLGVMVHYPGTEQSFSQDLPYGMTFCLPVVE